MSTSESGPDPEEAKQRRELLLKVYGVAVDEYRFNVQLGWDRTKFFLTLNSGLVAAGVGLLKVAEGSVVASSFLVLFFLMCLVVSCFGLETGRIAKAYYHESVFTKTLVERELGLLEPVTGIADPRGNLSIAVTDGMRDVDAVLSGKKRVADPRLTQMRWGSVTWNSQLALWVMILIESLAAIAALIDAVLAALP